MASAAVWQGLYLRSLFTGDFCCGAKVGVKHFFARALATDDLQETAAILRFRCAMAGIFWVGAGVMPTGFIN
jgi:hypothetical protein